MSDNLKLNQFSRRNFMLSSAALGALVPLGGCAESGRNRRGSLELGFSLYGMPGISLDRAVNTCADTGYTNVELALLPGFPTELEKMTPATITSVKKALAATGLRVSSLLVNISLIGPEARHDDSMHILGQATRISTELGQPEPPVIQTVLGGKPGDLEHHTPIMVQRLREWDEFAEAQSIMIAVKAHAATSIGTPEQLLWLMRQAETTHIVVDFDQSHYRIAGIPLRQSLPPLAALTRFVHLKDASGDSSNYKFLLPGEGDTDYSALFTSLRHYHYRGPVVVEVSRQIFSVPGYDPMATVRNCFQKLAPYL